MRWFAGPVAFGVWVGPEARAEDATYDMRFLVRASDAPAADYSGHRGMVTGSFGFGTGDGFVGSVQVPRCLVADDMGDLRFQFAPDWQAGGFEQKNLLLVAPGTKPIHVPSLTVLAGPFPDQPGPTSTFFPEGTRLTDIVEEYAGTECRALLDGVDVEVRLFVATVDVPRP